MLDPYDHLAPANRTRLDAEPSAVTAFEAAKKVYDPLVKHGQGGKDFIQTADEPG